MDDKQVDEIEFLQSIETSTSINLTDDQMYEFCNKQKLDQAPLPNITLNTISNGGNGSGIYGDYYNQCFYISLVGILKNTGIAQDITVEELRRIGNLKVAPDNQMWDNDKLADRNAIDYICNYFYIEVRFINSTSDIPRRVKHGSVLLPGCKIPLGSWVKADQIQGIHKQPLEVYIAHMGAHFEAVDQIILDDEIIYKLEKVDGRNKNIETDHISQFLEKHSPKFKPKLSENIKSKMKCSKNSKVSSVDDSSNVIELTDFIMEYYNAIVDNKELTSEQLQLQKLYDILNNINFKLHHYESMNLEKNVIDLLETNRETDREIKETLLIILTDTIDEYEKNKKLRNNILKQINEFK
jgi:hypothetical protein